jgi:hypothetical protein
MVKHEKRYERPKGVFLWGGAGKVRYLSVAGAYVANVGRSLR